MGLFSGRLPGNRSSFLEVFREIGAYFPEVVWEIGAYFPEVVKIAMLQKKPHASTKPRRRVEKSGLGFRKLNHDVAVVPRNSSVICQRLIIFWIKEG